MSAEELQAFFTESVRGVFRTWLHIGDFAVALAEPNPPVYKTVGHFVSQHAIQCPGWEQATIAELLGKRSSDGTLRDTLRCWIDQSLPWFVQTTIKLADAPSMDERDAMELIAQKLLSGGDVSQLADSLLSTFESEMGSLTLMEAFRRRRDSFGLASWSRCNQELLEDAEEVAASELPPALRRNRLFLELTVHYDLEVPVKAVEWTGGSQDPDSEEWSCVAAGMVYRFSGGVRGRSEQLLSAADWISGGDFERAEAFVESHGDADAILKKGDIAFVWEWERRHGTQPGDGFECLAAICSKLRSEYPKLASIVFSVSPQRFGPRAEGEPPLITEARKSDLRKLEAYVRGFGDRLGLDVYVAAGVDHAV